MSSQLGSGILVVITNYSRPQNLPSVIQAWREQTVTSKIVVVDNSPPPKPGVEFVTAEPYPNKLFQGVEHKNGRADDVWRMGTNFGCPCHFYPALAEYKFRYVMFVDDDFIPGSKALAKLLGFAEASGGRFASIGQFDAARNFLLSMQPGKRYSGRSVPHCSPNSWVKAHITCRGHLVRQDLLYHAIPFRNKLVEKFGGEAENLCNIHDDFLMCLGIQMGTGFCSWMGGKPEDQDERLYKVNLDTPNDKTSLWKRPTHFQERSRLVDMALEIGWKQS